MEHRAEVCVIGGGLTGTSIAYHVAKAGRSVILAEQASLAAGASGASFGWVCAHFASYMTEYPRFHMRFMREGFGAYERIADELEPEIEYQPTGGMSLIYSEESWSAQAALARALTEEGIPAELVDRSEAVRREPALSGEFLGAIVSAREGLVNPLALVRAFARGATRRGGAILTEARVTGIARRGSGFQVETTRGPIAAERVVNAAGVGAPEIGRMVGLEIPVGPNRGQQLILEPGPQAIRGVVYGHVPVRQTRAGTCILGGIREAAGFDKRVTSEAMHFIAREAAQMMPCLGPRAVIRAFSGLRPVPADGLPILGPAPGVEGFFVAALHFGLTLAPLIGDLLAQCVLGKPPSVDLGPYSLARFAPAGEIPGNRSPRRHGDTESAGHLRSSA